MKRFLIALFSLNLLYSCSYPDIPPKTNLVGDKKNVEEVSKDFVVNFDPKYKVGMKFTYIMTNQKTFVTEEISSEILNIDGENITVKFTDSRGSKIEQAKLSEFNAEIPDTGIQKIGTETIKVPAGEFKDTTIVSYYPSSPDGKIRTKVTLWLVKDIGLVRKQELLQNSDILITELKEFKP